MELAERLGLGQWFTPVAVADLTLALALPRGRAAARRQRVLDPACGDGVFLARAAARGVPAAGLIGVEVEPAAAEAARAAVPGAEIQRADLFDWSGWGGDFDAVVGNPPYVRQERLGSAQKQRIRRRLAADWPDLPDSELAPLSGRADLAAAVIARALRLCRPGGRVALVVSSALFDAGYGRALWRLVARAGRVVAVVEAPAERWFADAAVNAVILVLERGAVSAGSSAEVLVARLRVSTDEAARRVRSLADLATVADIRRVPAGAPERWAESLRASPVWFEFAGCAGSHLVRLGELATVRRGITSGANDIFYLSPARAAELSIEPALLAPLLRSPRQAGGERIAIDPARLDMLALLAPPGEAELARFPAAARYLHRQAGAADRPTLGARRPWWALPARPARLFLTKAYAARFVQRLAPRPVLADQRLYSVHPRAGVDLELLAASLNATFTALALESLGRASLGEGALEWTVSGAASLPILDPRRLDRAAASRVRGALASLARRPIGTVAEEAGHLDRARLDRAIAPELAPLLPRAHETLIESTARRAARAARAG